MEDKGNTVPDYIRYEREEEEKAVKARAVEQAPLSSKLESGEGVPPEIVDQLESLQTKIEQVREAIDSLSPNTYFEQAPDLAKQLILGMTTIDTSVELMRQTRNEQRKGIGADKLIAWENETNAIADKFGHTEMQTAAASLKELFAAWQKSLEFQKSVVEFALASRTDSVTVPADTTANIVRLKKASEALLINDPQLSPDRLLPEYQEVVKRIHELPMEKAMQYFLDGWSNWLDIVGGTRGPKPTIEANVTRIQARAAVPGPISPLEISAEEALLQRVKDLVKTGVNGPSRIPSTQEQEKIWLQKQYVIDLETAVSKLKEVEKKIREAISAKKEEVDPKDPWKSFAVQQAWIEPWEDATTPENIRKIEKGILRWGLDYVTAELWEGPNNHEKRGEIKFFEAPVSRTADKLKLSDVLYKHPGPLEGHGSGKEFREIFMFLEKCLAGGMSWENVISFPKHEAVQEHLKEYMFDGSGYTAIQKLPEVGYLNEAEKEALRKKGSKEKSLGDMVFEGMNFYVNWNRKYIYLSQQEEQSLYNRAAEDVRSGVIKIPSRSDLDKAIGLINANTKNLNVEELLSSVDQPVPNAQVLLLYGLESKRPDGKIDYEIFKRKYIDEVSKQIRKKKEVDRQNKYGIHPLVEVGEAVGVEGDNGGAEAKKHLIEMRKEIAIAIGCYSMGLGDYTPTASASDGGILVDKNGNKRQLNHTERDRAFEIGKAAEMIAFTAYESNGGPIFDDAVSAKSSLTAGRLGLTSMYRHNYEAIGREGFFKDSIHIFQQLLPPPFRFMAVDGKGLRDVFSDRDLRMEADYETLGDGKGRKLKYLETYGFSVQIYNGLAYGISNPVKGADLLALAKVEKPQGVFSTEKILRFNDSMLQEIVTYVEKQIGYYMDRMSVSQKELHAKDSTFDETYFKDIPGTKVASPFYKQNLNLPDAHWETVIEDINTYGFKRALIKVFVSSIIIESLIRSGAREMSVDQVQALKYVLTGMQPSLYAIKGKESSLSTKLSSAQYAAAFNFTPAEAAGLIEKAGLTLRSGLELFLARQGGI